MSIELRLLLPTVASRLSAALSVFFALFLGCGAQGGQTISGNPERQDLPASKAFQGWLERQRAGVQPAYDDPQVLTIGRRLAEARSEEMRLLLESDPEEFARRAMPEVERAQLPPDLRPLIEQRVKGRGFFGVYCVGLKPDEPIDPAHPKQRSGLAYEVRLNGSEYQAFVFGKWRNQTTVRDAAIDGIVLGDAIALGDSPTPEEQKAAGDPVSADTPTTTGPNTLLYVIARFSDEASDPIDDATALSRMGVVSSFWMNNSSGTVWLRGIVNPSQVMDIVHVTLPQPMSYGPTYNSSFGLLLSDARNAASAKGFNYANYNLDVTVTSNQGFGYAGRAYIGGQGAHLVGSYTTLRTAGHELGHNLGLYHADYWRTDSSRPFGRDFVPGGYVADGVNAEWIEYGHYFSLMSAQYGGEMDDATKPHYAAAEKVRLGWLSGGKVQYVTASGTYRLYRHDHGATLGTPRAIRIETPASDYTGNGRRYWLNYRYAPWTTGQSWLRNGVQVDVCQQSYGSDGAIQLDMTPFSMDQASGASYTSDNSDKLDGALVVGRTYSDRNAGIHITPISTGNNGANEEYIDVAVSLGSFPGNRPPSIYSFTISSMQVAPNQPVSFSVGASDPDGDPLAYSWDFDEVQKWTSSGLNSPSADKSWPGAGQYRVVVTVSDLKGGIATESLIVTVGAPANTNQIWGRVVWGGQAVYGARVWTTLGGSVNQAWTDSDGTYVLTDLDPASTYPVYCAADSLTFTPQFANPVSVAAGSVYGRDFYANEPLSGGGGATKYVASGQVTDAGTGVAGVEMRGGGMVVTTDGAGNYQFTNFVSGGYTLVPRNGSWAFSPASRNVTISSANSSGNNFSRVAPYSIAGRVNGVPAGPQDPAPTVYLSTGRSVQATRQGSGQNRYWGYTLNNVPAGQFSLGAQLSGFQIVPGAFGNPLTIAGNLSNMDFNGTAGTIAGAISGRITRFGLPLAGATVQVKLGAVVVNSGLSDSDGCYRVDNLTNAAYTILPGLAGYSFTPSSLNVSSVPASGKDFSATGGGSPPIITSVTANPAVVASVAGGTTLSVAATGSGTLTYSWDALGGPAPVTFGVNDSPGAAFTTAGFQSPGNYTFRARVTGTNGLPSTGNVNVTVSAGPGALVVAPYEAQTAVGQTIQFRADAWDQLGNRITVSALWYAAGGAIDSNGLYSAATPGGPYLVTATSGGLTATGFVWVAAGGAVAAPVITGHPQNQTVTAGSNANFTVTATGTPPLNYLWLREGAPIPGATASSYTRNNVQPSDAGNYRVVVTNLSGSATSSNALLAVIVPPLVTIQPSGLAVAAGSNVTFTALASGTTPLNYQWSRNGSNIVGATSDTLSRPNAQTADAGSYVVVVTNNGGSATSIPAILTVNNAPSLSPITDQIVHAGGSVFVTNSATDVDIPVQTLTFSLDPGAPSGAMVNPTNGVFQWHPAVTSPVGTNFLTLRVIDNGIPSLGASRGFAITVVEPLTIQSIESSNGFVTIKWNSIPGKDYRMLYRTNAAAGIWTPLGPDIPAASTSTSKTDSIGGSQRLYRVMLLE